MIVIIGPYFTQVNTVVSGALDRLHYEKDPCVKYDIGRKLWIYLHRDRSQEEFGNIQSNRGYIRTITWLCVRSLRSSV